MGLDMYLHRKIYIGGNYKSNQISGEISIFKNGNKFPLSLEKVIYVEEDAIYWRKVNAIHAWFVENVQNGEDDCWQYPVSIEDLENLLSTIKSVLENHELSQKLLPCEDGFFFGDTEYGEYYFSELERTKNELEKIVNDPYNKEWEVEFTYQASW